MSQLVITKYLNELSDLKKVSGSARESVVREAFKDLLKAMGRAHDLVFIPEHHIVTPAKTNIYVDGANAEARRGEKNGEDAGRRGRPLNPDPSPAPSTSSGGEGRANNHQGCDLSLCLCGAARSDLSREIRAEPEA